MWIKRPLFGPLLSITVIVHACAVLAVHQRTGRIDAFAFKSIDCGEFYRIAKNVAEHGTFSQGSSAEGDPLKPDTWRTPGYPFFLAIFIFLFGAPPTLLILGQQMLCVLNVLLLFQIARRSMSELRAATVALLFLFEPYHLYYSLWLMSTTLFVTAMLLTWYAWGRAVKSRSWTWPAWTGAWSGLAILIRPIAVFVPIVLLGGFIWRAVRDRHDDSGGHPNSGRWWSVSAYSLACVVVVGAWMVRNKIVAGHLALSDQGGVVLAYFKATEAVLWRQGRTAERYDETSLDPAKANLPHKIWNDIDAQLRAKFPQAGDDARALLRWKNLAQGNKTPFDSFEVSAALADIGRSYLLDAPLSSAACYVVRCGSILTFPLSLIVKPPRGTEGTRLSRLVLTVPYLILSLAVVLRLARRRLTFAAMYFPLAATAVLLLATTPQIDPRFRVPMVPLLLVAALLPRQVRV